MKKRCLPALDFVNIQLIIIFSRACDDFQRAPTGGTMQKPKAIIVLEHHTRDWLSENVESAIEN